MAIDNKPVTRKDLVKAFGDFFEQVLVPYFEEHVSKRFDKVEKKLEEHDKRFEQIDKRFDEMEGNMNRMERTLDLVAEKVTDHAKKIAKLEQISKAS